MMQYIIHADITAWPLCVRQDGTIAADSVHHVAVGIDGSVFLAGATYGDWSGVNAGESDFAVVKLDADGNETWRWHVR